ncbi:hypothetical protein BHE74_00056239 [Ensete ventricosum]|nr:hypothetical protein GW17_00054156 [Ensete ventricosum]RWW38523.1 hypothetical protein BHE74_00056239 [Ensete ventricosum]
MASALTRLLRRPAAVRSRIGFDPRFLDRFFTQFDAFVVQCARSLQEWYAFVDAIIYTGFLPLTQHWTNISCDLLRIYVFDLKNFSTGDLVAAVVPYMGESITDGTLATFLKKPGDRVNVDEPIAQVETDKVLVLIKLLVTIDVNSPEAGIIQEVNDKVAKDAQPPSPPAETPPPTAAVEKIDRQMPKGEIPAKEKPKASSPLPAKTSPSEPQLPPKERERRSFKFHSLQVPMPRLRKRVATRLKDSQNTFAMLTTFNEVDM